MIKCKEKLNSPNKSEENSKKQRTSARKRKWKLKQIFTNEARSTTRWINGDSCSLNVKRCRAKNM